MTNFFTAKLKGFIISHFVLNILIFILFWIIGNLRVWMIFLGIYLIVIVVTLIRDLVWSRWSKRLYVYARQMDRLVTILRDLIDQALVYDEDPGKFYRKFLETVNIESLRERGIIDPEALLRTPRFNPMYRMMTRSDVEILALSKAGFSNRELKVIYNLSNINSIYIKRHRAKTRLTKIMDEIRNQPKYMTKN